MTQLNLTKPLVFFDLETTGVNVVNDRVVEICLLKVDINNQTSTHTYRINPEMPIPEQSSQIHGIYDEDIKDSPTFKELAPTIASIIGNADLAGYNSNKFDVPMLVEEFARVEYPFEIKGRKLIDVQNIFHKMEQRTLVAAYKFYCDQDLINAHSAEADVVATYEILKAQIDRYQNIEFKDKDGSVTMPIQNDMNKLANFSTMNRNVDLVGHIIFNNQKEEVFNFGKHKGKSVTEIFNQEPSYYDWMMKSEFPASTKQVITAIKLRSFNKGATNII